MVKRGGGDSGSEERWHDRCGSVRYLAARFINGRGNDVCGSVW